jgi:hypothetical protein
LALICALKSKNTLSPDPSVRTLGSSDKRVPEGVNRLGYRADCLHIASIQDATGDTVMHELGSSEVRATALYFAKRFDASFKLGQVFDDAEDPSHELD